MLSHRKTHTTTQSTKICQKNTAGWWSKTVGVGGEPIQKVSHAPAVEDFQTLQFLSIGEVKLSMKQLDVTKSTSSDDFLIWV